MPVYLVSGLPRSGTSMMMHCLKAGGMRIASDASQEPLNVTYGHDGYKPNPNGFYAMAADFTAPGFPAAYEGQVVKAPREALLSLPDGDYRLCFMKRNPAEIRASMQRFMPYAGAWSEDALLEIYDLYVPALVERLRDRGMQAMELDYAQVVDNPLAAFGKLSLDMWPVDAAAAVSVVDPALYRFRLERA